ncbi:MAG: CehA/McbA family metallohydrolase, partial [Acidimicrobiia bacterium]
PSGLITVRLFDDETDQPTAARIYLSDELGPARPSGAAIRRDRHGNAYFYADQGFEARVSGQTRLTIARGIEYEPAELEIEIRSEEHADLAVRLTRWSHMATEGWRSGDVHVHLHYGGEYRLTPADAALAQRAEDVGFLNMMVANWRSGWVHDYSHFQGEPHRLSDRDHILQWGEEYRNDFYGHLCLFGIEELVPPIYSGFPFSEHPHDSPANAEAAAHAHRVGGRVSYAHPMFDGTELDRVFQRARTFEAKELPVDAVLGDIDAVDIMSYPADNLETARLWYRLLNCGLRLAATAGTDTFMNMVDGAQSVMGARGRKMTSPVAGDRVFAKIDGGFTTDSFAAAVGAGRTFVTNGPMLTLTVEGRRIGDRIEARPGDRLRVEAAARSHLPMDRIELIVNGRVTASTEAVETGQRAGLRHQLTVTESCWIALRALGPAHPLVLDESLFAHTSPIYVDAEGQPVASAEDAAYFVEWIDRLCAMAEETGRYATDEDRDTIIELFREAQQRYRELPNGPL